MHHIHIYLALILTALEKLDRPKRSKNKQLIYKCIKSSVRKNSPPAPRLIEMQAAARVFPA